MREIFTEVLNISITTGWMILTVLVLRSFIKKVSNQMVCFLWLFVGIRLICPFSIESAFSLIPSSQTVHTDVDATRPYIRSGFVGVDNRINEYIGEQYIENVSTPQAAQSPLEILAIVWMVGMCAILIYMVCSYLYLHKKVRVSLHIKENVYTCDSIKTPFILGIIKSRIYLPSDMKPEICESVLAHEMAHLKRKDHISKFAGFLLLAVYWFHPLIWIFYMFLCRDIEMACDERVVRNMEDDEKKIYLNALLECSVKPYRISISTLAFGEVGIKERVRAVMKHKKRTFRIVVCGVVACIVLLLCFMTNPIKKASDTVEELLLPLDEVVETTYVYEKEGFGGEFQITLFKDGSFNYYEGMLSSYIGKGEWEVEEGILVLKDNNESHPKKHYFMVDKDVITFIEEISDNFLYIKVKDGEKFFRGNKSVVVENGELYPVEVLIILLSEPCGSDGARLYYADEDTIIFGGYFGLFVYDTKKEDYYRSVDLSAIGCDKTQGEDMCEIKVSDDGAVVYLHPLSSDEMLVFSVEDNTLCKKEYSVDNIDFYDGYDEETGLAAYVENGEERYAYLVNRFGNLGELGYSREPEMSYYKPLFVSDELKDAEW